MGGPNSFVTYISFPSIPNFLYVVIDIYIHLIFVNYLICIYLLFLLIVFSFLNTLDGCNGLVSPAGGCGWQTCVFFSCSSMAVASAVNGHGVDRWSWVGSLFVRPFLSFISRCGEIRSIGSFVYVHLFLLAWRRSTLAAAMRAAIHTSTSSLIPHPSPEPPLCSKIISK